MASPVFATHTKPVAERLCCGKVDVQTEKSGRERIVITEIPYMVNKAKMVERIADLVHEKKIDGIVTLR